jgi:hypothetical protein
MYAQGAKIFRRNSRILKIFRVNNERINAELFKVNRVININMVKFQSLILKQRLKIDEVYSL